MAAQTHSPTHSLTHSDTNTLFCSHPHTLTHSLCKHHVHNPEQQALRSLLSVDEDSSSWATDDAGAADAAVPAKHIARALQLPDGTGQADSLPLQDIIARVVLQAAAASNGTAAVASSGGHEVRGVARRAADVSIGTFAAVVAPASVPTTPDHLHALSLNALPRPLLAMHPSSMDRERVQAATLLFASLEQQLRATGTCTDASHLADIVSADLGLCLHAFVQLWAIWALQLPLHILLSGAGANGVVIALTAVALRLHHEQHASTAPRNAGGGVAGNGNAGADAGAGADSALREAMTMGADAVLSSNASHAHKLAVFGLLLTIAPPNQHPPEVRVCECV